MAEIDVYVVLNTGIVSDLTVSEIKIGEKVYSEKNLRLDEGLDLVLDGTQQVCVKTAEGKFAPIQNDARVLGISFKRIA